MTGIVTRAYSVRASEYAGTLGSMTAVHASDRQVIDTWADGLRGPVVDAGCGPGHWTNHLATLGLDVRGIDLVPEFIEHARTTYPGVRFDSGSLDDMDEPDGGLGGVLSWYSTIHHTPEQILRPIEEFARVLRPGGGLVLGFFHAEAVERFDHAVTPAYRWPASEVHGLLEAAGFEIIETHIRIETGRRPHGAIVCRRGVAPPVSLDTMP